eukprot:TRINITY_DN948_c3_g3_i5.p2 TRINITY_DN948_c3_g3~~TRINITY_DN948_c3_g3_i5.p2  ORF type:complete len:388 (+),score=111.53 TRINITY_DN948_c3_g3_i5:234-1397(+)
MRHPAVLAGLLLIGTWSVALGGPSAADKLNASLERADRVAARHSLNRPDSNTVSRVDRAAAERRGVSNMQLGLCSLKVIHGGLNDRQKQQLCGSKRDSGPAKCVNELAKRYIFSAQQLADICSEASGTGPAHCAVRAFARAGKKWATVMCGNQGGAKQPYDCFLALRKLARINDEEAAVLCRGSTTDGAQKCAQANLESLPHVRVPKCRGTAKKGFAAAKAATKASSGTSTGTEVKKQDPVRSRSSTAGYKNADYYRDSKRIADHGVWARAFAHKFSANVERGIVEKATLHAAAKGTPQAVHDYEGELRFEAMSAAQNPKGKTTGLVFEHRCPSEDRRSFRHESKFPSKERRDMGELVERLLDEGKFYSQEDLCTFLVDVRKQLAAP